MKVASKVLAVLTACCLIAMSPAMAADPYPTKPIRMVVAFPAGGSADINARAVGQQLAKELGGTLIVDNKGGAGGNVGAVEVKRAVPDGYTLFYATSAIVLSPSLYANPGFDPYSDYIPIALTATIPLALVVNATLPPKSFSEFVTWAKNQGGKLNYASSGSGALLHLAGALLTSEFGISANHIPYRGSAPAVNDLLGGQTQFMFLPVNEATPHIVGGRLRAIAVASEKRVPQLPQVPTIREATGKTNMDMGAWQGLMAPKGTPDDVVKKLTAAIQKTLHDKDLTARLEGQGSVILGGTQKQYVDYMHAEGERWANVIKKNDIKLD